jgi:tRNA threonylcarbamoyladenosine biosynthesis protein TsaB
VIVLGLDTATNTGSVAIVRDGEVVAEASAESKRHGAELLPMIDDIFARAQIRPRDLDAIAIGAGPGSFTGLRIGMATAKGIAFAAGRPLWAVSSLAAIAHDIGGDDPIACVLDARRGEVFAGIYRRDVALVDERVMPPGELVAWVDGVVTGARYCGDAVRAFPELAPLGWTEITPSGRAVARLALAGGRTDVLATGVPAYLRRAEAEILYPDGVPGALRRPE